MDARVKPAHDEAESGALICGVTGLANSQTIGRRLLRRMGFSRSLLRGSAISVAPASNAVTRSGPERLVPLHRGFDLFQGGLPRTRCPPVRLSAEGWRPETFIKAAVQFVGATYVETSYFRPIFLLYSRGRGSWCDERDPETGGDPLLGCGRL